MIMNCLPQLLPLLRLLQVFGCIGGETRLEEMGEERMAVT
jgi:hypothetical protein